MKESLVFACVFKTVDQQIGIQFNGPMKGQTVTVFGVDVLKSEFRVSSSMDNLKKEVKEEAIRKYANMVQHGKFVRFPKFKAEKA